MCHASAMDRLAITLTICNYWRSRQKWFTGANSVAWLHKQPFRRSLYLKGLLPQAQTLPITPTVRSVLPEMGGADTGAGK